MREISGVASTSAAMANPVAVRAGSAPGGVPFSEVVSELLSSAGHQHTELTERMHQLASGDVGVVQELVVGTAKADLALQLVIEVRNQLISAYQDVMRMPM